MAVHSLRQKPTGPARTKRTSKLSAGRPPTAPKAVSFSKKTRRKLIESGHTLSKQLSKAQSKGDTKEASALQKQIDDLGGLHKYQLASIQGQANQRGGDSSVVLMEWLRELAPEGKSNTVQALRLLEIGALSTENACSRTPFFGHIERIDLNSQAAGIKKQDFMERPLPNNTEECFHAVSLSLVLNFVPDAEARGEMLKRLGAFLRSTQRAEAYAGKLFPVLFLVLPAPCVTNSRYLDEERLGDIMEALGYAMVQRKLTARLVYYLWRFDCRTKGKASFAKKEVNPGAKRNNFCVVLGD